MTEGKMKKIGGLTWWRNNYGSILQAYALQQTLNSYDGIEYEIINQYSSKIASYSNLVLKIKENGFISTAKRFVFRFGLRKLRKRVSAIEQFINKHLKVSTLVYNEASIAGANAIYDAFLCGSDQVWNPANVPLTSIYWLNFVEKGKKKYSYAASIGISKTDDKQADTIRKNLADFDGITCREDDGTALINEIMGKTVCETVLDPTLLAGDQLWDSFSSKRIVKEPYVFAYMLRGTKADRKLVEKFAKKKNLKLVTIPFLDAENIELYDCKFGDIKIWAASPEDFLSLIRHADYVFTDSFHCMIFSIRYQRTFFTFRKLGKAQMSRILGLQTKLKTGDRMINSDMTVSEVEELSDINWETVIATLKTEREKSKNYVDSMIAAVKNA